MGMCIQGLGGETQAQIVGYENGSSRSGVGGIDQIDMAQNRSEVLGNAVMYLWVMVYITGTTVERCTAVQQDYVYFPNAHVQADLLMMNNYLFETCPG